jgi:CBS domain-containing protein
MTHRVVTAEASSTLGDVAALMRDHNVGSVVICDSGRPVGVLTDRDLALAVGADRIGRDERAGAYASHPVVTGEIEMDLEEVAQLMIENRIRRLPILDGDDLVGIVTIDDVAVRAGDLTLAQRMTAEVARQAIPEFYFHQRGG